ncbi:MAG: nucleotidyltransferase domain-containing protein [Trichlorobacter sp.]|uniref:nucleotidyltransferase family protein n=1 Tax=Trichlorobacter sp. TaxID=2911007 RepID=UPI0025676F51|nr:nucleotidyltransferase domain-containing protein [Trichlorobacter sp.]MDK9718515.1 nucleotidyltransferase domain-containing protein [Trichlorobacter sp.]
MRAGAVSTLGLTPHDQAELSKILHTSLAGYTVWAFGSRVSGSPKTYSDLDLVIVTEQPLSLEQMATLHEAFEESDLAIRVDLVDWATASDSFRRIILQQYLVVQEG